MVSRPSVVTVSSFGRQKLIENMTRVSIYAFKQVIVSFLKEFCYTVVKMNKKHLLIRQYYTNCIVCGII